MGSLLNPEFPPQPRKVPSVCWCLCGWWPWFTGPALCLQLLPAATCTVHLNDRGGKPWIYSSSLSVETKRHISVLLGRLMTLVETAEPQPSCLHTTAAYVKSQTADSVLTGFVSFPAQNNVVISISEYSIVQNHQYSSNCDQISNMLPFTSGVVLYQSQGWTRNTSVWFSPDSARPNWGKFIVYKCINKHVQPVHFINDQHPSNSSAYLQLKNEKSSNVLSAGTGFMHLFLSENRMAARINESRLEKDQYVYDIRVKASVRNCWGLCVILQLFWFIQRVALPHDV